MKKPQGLSMGVLGCALLALGLLVNSGCASKPKTDWNSRIGNLTFDQAVMELGPTFGNNQLADGTRVAEWFLKPGPQISFGLGTGFHGGSGAVGVGQSVAVPTPGHYLRLVFGPDGQLQSWEKVRH